MKTPLSSSSFLLLFILPLLLFASLSVQAVHAFTSPSRVVPVSGGSTAETTSMAMTSSSGGDAAAVDLETEAFHKCIASAVDLSDAHVDETNGYLSGKDEDAVCLVVAVDWF